MSPTRPDRRRGPLVALGAALAGALLALALGLPAAALVGATLAVTLVAVGGWEPSVPGPLRDVAFAVIGLTLGSGVSPALLGDLGRYSTSLVLMVLSLALSTGLALAAMHAMLTTDRRTAVLATSPGALSYALALAAERDVDVRTVTVLQGIRLFAVTVFVPPIVAWVDRGGGQVGAPEAPVTGSLASLLMLGAASLLAPVLVRLRLPSAWLWSGLVVSGLAHGTGWVEGRPDPSLLFAGFTVAGAVVGARFAGIARGELVPLVRTGAAIAAASIAASGLVAFPVAAMLELPFGQVWVAYAPGGVEGMAAIAIALDYDAVYVAAHHTVRLLVLIALLPILLRG